MPVSLATAATLFTIGVGFKDASEMLAAVPGVTRRIQSRRARVTFSDVWDEISNELFRDLDDQVRLAMCLSTAEFEHALAGIQSSNDTDFESSFERMWRELERTSHTDNSRIEPMRSSEEGASDENFWTTVDRLYAEQHAFRRWYVGVLERVQRRFYQRYRSVYDDGLELSEVRTQLERVSANLAKTKQLVEALLLFMFIYIILHAGFDVAISTLSELSKFSMLDEVSSFGLASAISLLRIYLSRQPTRVSEPRRLEGNDYL